MADKHPTIPGGNAQSYPGKGDNASTGVVVVHGFTGNPNSTRPVAEALAAEGYTVELVRLPGHGTSWRDMAKTRYPDWKLEVERVVAEVGERCDKVVLVGLSMGGTICLDVASGWPHAVDGVATVNAQILSREGLLAQLAGILQYVLPIVPPSMADMVENDIAKPGQDEKAYPLVPTKAGHSFITSLPRIRQQLAKLTCPVLVMYSPEDHTVPAENSRAIEGLVGTDDVTEVVLERSYHVATLDWDAELIQTSVLEFLERVTAR